MRERIALSLITEQDVVFRRLTPNLRPAGANNSPQKQTLMYGSISHLDTRAIVLCGNDALLQLQVVFTFVKSREINVEK